VEQRLFDRAWGGGRRMRRGDVRGEILSALLEGPAHGYEVIRRLEEKSGGAWRPSPGSVYPTLQMLEDAGLVRATEREGRRTYELTDEGRAEAEAGSGDARRGGRGPSGAEETEGRAAIRSAVMQLHLAARQVAMSGTPDQVDRAAAALRQARQALYLILAED
jgi:DNA-binding PadR family transcriptional regulator